MVNKAKSVALKAAINTEQKDNLMAQEDVEEEEDAENSDSDSD